MPSAAIARSISASARTTTRRLFCKGDEPIFDSFIPLSLRGKLAATAMSGLNRAKRLVKHNQALFHLAQQAAQRVSLRRS